MNFSSSKWKSGLENALIFWSGLLIVLVFAGQRLVTPDWVQVIGRTHPLILHFPVVLLSVVAGLLVFGKKFPQIPLKPILLIAANFTGFTVVAGLLLATEDYQGATLDYHQWLGIATYGISLAVYFTNFSSQQLQQILGLALGILLIGTGHFGAELTHGENFLTGPILKNDSPTIALEDAEVFKDLIQPVFESKCISCHKDGKAKGELRLDHWEGIQKGGENGSFLTAGDPDNSLFLQRIHLPLEDEDHMPPKNKSQLTEEEIELLRLWVSDGAANTQKVSELGTEHPLYAFASQKFAANKTYDFDPADPKTLANLSNFFRKVTPIFPGSPALEVAYYGSSSFDPKSLSDLTKIKEQTIKLNLNRMPLRDVDLAILGDFKNLEEIQLNFSDIQMDQLLPLARLPKLKKLAISGNPISPDEVEEFKDLDFLEKLYFWQPEWTEDAQQALKDVLPSTDIVFGFQGKNIVYELNPPKITIEKELFEDSVEVTISHPIGSTLIKYTLDGSEPDSLQSLTYTSSFWIKSTAQLKARVFAKDWLGSPSTQTTVFKKGIVPSEIRLTHEPHSRYQANGKATLFDGVKGKANHTSGEWLGFTDQPFDLEMKLPQTGNLKEISVSLLLNESAYIFPPEQAEIWIKTNGSWEKVTIPAPEQSEKLGEVRFGVVTFPLPPKAIESLRLKLKPIAKLPAWHPGAGAKGWVFVDEILIN